MALAMIYVDVEIHSAFHEGSKHKSKAAGVIGC